MGWLGRNGGEDLISYSERSKSGRGESYARFFFLCGSRHLTSKENIKINSFSLFRYIHRLETYRPPKESS